MSGHLSVIGLGPGDARCLTPEADDALAQAHALYGYGPYLDRVPARAGQRRHPSDNREEPRAPPPRCAMRRKARASPSSRAAIPACLPWRLRSATRSKRARTLAHPRRRDRPRDHGDARRCGAGGRPARHDFCALSLSDNLKPWDLILRRLDAAASAGLSSRSTIRSHARGRGNSPPPSSGCAAICRRRRRSSSAAPSARPDEQVDITTLAAADTAQRIWRRSSSSARGNARHPGPGHPPLVYTPRAVAEVSA